MSPARIDRREFLISGITLAGAGVVGASALGCFTDQSDDLIATAPASPRNTAKPGPGTLDLSEPTIISSIGGVLSASIVCETRPVNIAGRMIMQPVTYNGSFPGPMLWARPGDLVDLQFTNKIVFDQTETKPGYGRPPRTTNATNLHYHGLHISPIGTADNMAITVPANGTQRYLFRIPLEHPAGLFWYHAHVHGLVTNHVGRGAAGMLYIANAYTDQIGSLGIRRRLMMLQQAYLDLDEKSIIADDGERDDPVRALSLINGQLLPEIHMLRGEPQVWSILNASTSAFYLLRLEGHTFDVIAVDGIPLPSPRLSQTALLMASGTRLEVVVSGEARVADTRSHTTRSTRAWTPGRRSRSAPSS